MALILKRLCFSLAGNRSACRIKGFTLLEVMVALAILAIALTSIYRLHAQTIEISARNKFYSLAPLLAEGKLAEIERQGVKNSNDGSGDFGQDLPGFNWVTRIEEVTSDLIKGDQYHLARIEITIDWNQEETYTLRSYRFFTE